eukprot:3002273-Amphidinium_carterae.1
MAEEEWRTCLANGHPQLDASVKLLSSQWVIELPLTAEQNIELEGTYCSAVIFALHWEGGPGTALTSFAIAVPAAACEGIEEPLEIAEAALHFPGIPMEEQGGEPVQVGIIFLAGSDLGRLQEATPVDSLLIAFDTLFPDGLPDVTELFGAVQEWGPLNAPVTLTLERVGGLPYIVQGLPARPGAPEEEGYHSLTEISPPMAIGQVQGLLSLPNSAAAEGESAGAADIGQRRRVPGTPVVQARPAACPAAPPVHPNGGVQRKAAAAALSASAQTVPVGARVKVGGAPPL